MKQLFNTTCLLLLICGFTACKKDKLALHSKTFNLQKFSANLKTQITASESTQPEGYSFIINRDGQIADSFSFGIAYKNSAAGNGAWHANQEINIASVTKAFTAMAVFQLLKKNNLKVTDSIGNWLPAYFNASTAIRNTSFEKLMTHSSGILESSTSYDSIIAIVRRPLANPSRPFNQYSNVNFAIFRIIIPFLRDKSSATSQEASMIPANPDGYEKWLSGQYIGYMQQNVFTPAGLGTTNCKPSLNTAQAFSEPSNVTQSVANLNDWTEVCGGGGYFMSVREMAQVMAYLAHSTALLDFNQKQLMDSKYMGWDISDSRMTYAGRAYGKNGALRWDSNNNGVAPDQGDAGLQTLVMKFPNAVELALAINSLPGQWRSLSGMAAVAYDGAWE